MDRALDLPAVEYAERSDPGRDPSKQVNEDACGHRETRLGHLCVVCDGMGGHAAGREAAELALATIVETFDQAADGASPADVLRAAIEEASRRVYAMPTNEVALGRPGSTVVAALMHARGTEIAHVGDSRAYLVHEGQIFRVTRDHSIVQEMVDRGLLTMQQAAQHPDANRITRALGMAPEVEADVRPQPVHHVTGDAFVLCSDGLSDLVEDAEILDTVGNVPAGQAVGKLVDLANARGGHDNITVIVLRARTTANEVAGGGVAPTIAQTRVPDAAFAATPTLVEHGALSSPAPVTLANTPLEPTMPPTATHPPWRRSAHPAIVVSLALASVAIAALAAVFAVHFAERAGHRNAPSDRAPELRATEFQDAGTGASAVGYEGGARAMPNPTPLVPASIDVPAPLPPDGNTLAPLEPLESAPDLPRLPHRKKKQ